jgi:Ca2+-binding RTX toxin-like protein
MRPATSLRTSKGLSGSQKNDVLTGDEKNNTIWANAGDDIVSTGAGNDWVEAQDGDDVVNLGSGDDQAVGGRGADTIDGGEGFDYARYDASAEGVNIDLAKGTATGGDATGDKLIEHRRTCGITEERRSHR